MSAQPQTVERRDGFVQSLERGLAVIRAFDSDHPSLTLTEVATRTGVSRAATRRFLLTLIDLGYVDTDGREFYLRPQLLELGHAYLSALGLPEISQPHLRHLADAVGESSSVAVLDGTDIVYVARVATYRIMAASIVVGTRFPAFVTSMGRAIIGAGSRERQEQFLAATARPRLTSHTLTEVAALRRAFEEVRAQGWALVDQELEEGLRSIAAPIRDATGAVVAAVNVSAPVRRGDIDAITADLLPHVLHAAQGISHDLQRAGTAVRNP